MKNRIIKLVSKRNFQNIQLRPAQKLIKTAKTNSIFSFRNIYSYTRIEHFWSVFEIICR